ncbi:tyrosinase cofactor [Streptomyces sp. NBC_01497]|nr:tyrosinase family oxidase copper chaperone [Streptomyces sp. NBC_01497]
MAGAATHGGSPRRTLVRTLFGLGVLGGTAAALSPLVRADGAALGGAAVPDSAAAAAPGAGADPYGPSTGPVTEETYRGRHIRVRHSAGQDAVEAAVPAPGVYPAAASDDVLIDGRPLPVMRRADGSYLSAVNHYESFPTLVAAARAAVDDLRGARLALDDPMIHHA